MTIAKKVTLDAALYLIATPIGTARDITLRALDLLTSADILVAEDTRSLRKLMDIHGVALDGRPIWSYHDHSSEKVRIQITSEISNGKSVVYASEAGTPMIADPGYALVRDVIAIGAEVVSAPGPSAVITALTLSALPTDQFYFGGFLPNSGSRRRAALEDLKTIPATLVLYESPKRIAATLADARDVLGAERPASLCRELTKKFQEIRRDSLTNLTDWAKATTLKGEIVLVIGKAQQSDVNEADLEAALGTALQTMSVRDAANMVAETYEVPRRKVYQQALLIVKSLGGEDK